MRKFLLTMGLALLLSATAAAADTGASRFGQPRGRPLSAERFDPFAHDRVPKSPAPSRTDRIWRPLPIPEPPRAPTADFGRRHLAPYTTGERIRFCLRTGGTLYCYDDLYPRSPHGALRGE